jgi:hypothetical protein
VAPRISRWDLCSRGLARVSSVVRTLGLVPRCYDRLLDFFHSSAVDVDRLTVHWTQRALALLPVHRFAGKLVLLGDGIKIASPGPIWPKGSSCVGGTIGFQSSSRTAFSAIQPMRPTRHFGRIATTPSPHFMRSRELRAATQSRRPQGSPCRDQPSGSFSSRQ